MFIMIHSQWTWFPFFFIILSQCWPTCWDKEWSTCIVMGGWFHFKEFQYPPGLRAMGEWQDDSILHCMSPRWGFFLFSKAENPAVSTSKGHSLKKAIPWDLWVMIHVTYNCPYILWHFAKQMCQVRARFPICVGPIINYLQYNSELMEWLNEQP
jgi:hypothetical protein